MENNNKKIKDDNNEYNTDIRTKVETLEEFAKK